MIIMIINLVLECSCVPFSSVSIGCYTDYTVAGKCTVDGRDNKEDKTREEADMTLSLFFSKSVTSSPKVIQNMGNSQKYSKYGFGPL